MAESSIRQINSLDMFRRILQLNNNPAEFTDEKVPGGLGDAYRAMMGRQLVGAHTAVVDATATADIWLAIEAAMAASAPEAEVPPPLIVAV